MSSAPAARVPRASRVVRSPSRAAPRLHVVTARVERVNSPTFVAICLVVLGLGLLSVLLLNTTLAKGAYELRTLQKQATSLADTQDELTRDIDEAASPSQLAKRAAALGMVPATHPAFIDLANGKVLGKAKPARRSDGSVLVGAGLVPSATPKPRPTKKPAATTNKPRTSTTPAPTAKPRTNTTPAPTAKPRTRNKPATAGRPSPRPSSTPSAGRD